MSPREHVGHTRENETSWNCTVPLLWHMRDSGWDLRASPTCHRHSPVIHHYGMSEISYNKLVWAAVRDHVPAALNMTMCQFLGYVRESSTVPLLHCSTVPLLHFTESSALLVRMNE